MVRYVKVDVDPKNAMPTMPSTGCWHRQRSFVQNSGFSREIDFYISPDQTHLLEKKLAQLKRSHKGGPVKRMFCEFSAPILDAELKTPDSKGNKIPLIASVGTIIRTKAEHEAPVDLVERPTIPIMETLRKEFAAPVIVWQEAYGGYFDDH